MGARELRQSTGLLAAAFCCGHELFQVLTLCLLINNIISGREKVF